MADWSDIQVAHNALNNPFTSGADLSAIAQTQPSLWPGVAAHPNAFPELLSWLGQFGDPAVQATLASRGATAQSGFAPTSNAPGGFNQSQPLGYANPTTEYVEQASGNVSYSTNSAPTPLYGQGAPQEPYSPVPAKKSKRPWILAAVGILVVALIAVFVIVGVGGGGGIIGVDIPKTPADLEQAVENRDPINCTFDVSGHNATVQTNDGWSKIKIGAKEFGQDVNILLLEDDGMYTWYSGVFKFGFKLPYHDGMLDWALNDYIAPGVFDGTIDKDDFTCKAPVGASAFDLPKDIEFN